MTTPKTRLLTSTELAKKANDEIRVAVERAAERAHDIAENVIRSVTNKHLFSLLGIREDWGKWVFESRSSNNATPIQRALESVLQVKAEELLTVLDDMPTGLTSLSPKELRKLRKTYTFTYNRILLERLTTLAEQLATTRAKKDAVALIESAEAEQFLEKT